MHGLDFLRFGPDYLSAKYSFIWANDFLCGTDVYNVYQTVSEQIAVYDLLEVLHRRPANDVLDFPS